MERVGAAPAAAEHALARHPALRAPRRRANRYFAALLAYLRGKAAEPFDWAQRPFFLRFHTEDRREREAAFRELCARLGTDATRDLAG